MIIKNHVQQSRHDDCAIACLSMLTGIEKSKIEKEINSDGFCCPLPVRAIVRFLTRRKIYAERTSGLISFSVAPNSVYLCTVLGKNGDCHLVVMTATEDCIIINDPNDEAEKRFYFDDKPDLTYLPIIDFILLEDCSI